MVYVRSSLAMAAAQPRMMKPRITREGAERVAAAELRCARS